MLRKGFCNNNLQFVFARFARKYILHKEANRKILHEKIPQRIQSHPAQVDHFRNIVFWSDLNPFSGSFVCAIWYFNGEWGGFGIIILFSRK